MGMESSPLGDLDPHLLGTGSLVKEGVLGVECLPLGGLDQRLLGPILPVWWLADTPSLNEVEDLPLGVFAVVLIKPDGGGRCIKL